MPTFRFCPLCAHELRAATIDGVERMRCGDEGCSFVHYDNPVPVVAVIAEQDGHVTLVRNKGWPDHWFGLVTGFLERGESPEEGALRELREELGLEGEIQSLVGVYPFEQNNQVIVAYHVLARGEIGLGDELAGYKNVPIEKLKPWPFATGTAVRDWLARRRAG